MSKWPLVALVVLFLLLSFQSVAQKLVVVDRIRVENGSLDGTKVVIEKNGQRVKSVIATSKNTYELDFQANYVISYEKDGYVTKRISFDTHVPEDRIAYGFLEFGYEVSIFKQYEGVNTIVFNQPVGKIFYSKDIDEFDYDTDYTKSIQAQLQQIQEQVEEKIAEEAAQIAEENKRQEQINKQVTSLVSSADKSASSGKLEDAVSKYTEALQLKEDPAIQQKIDDLQKQMAANQAQAETQQQFEKLMVDAENARSTGNLEGAKTMLTQAQALLANDPRSAKMLAEINQQEQAAAQTEEQFQKLVSDAKADMANQAYAPALAKLDEAGKLKPNNPEVQTLVQNATAALETAEKQQEAQLAKRQQFEELVAAADKAFDNGNLAEAKTGYEAATALIPDAGIDSKIKSIEARLEAEVTKKADFEELLKQADASLAAGELENARTSYQQAGEMFDDPRVAAGLASVEEKEKEVAEAQKAAAAVEQAEQEKQASYDAKIKQADEKMAAGDLNNAERLYKDALAIMDQDHPRQKLDEISAHRAEQAAMKEASEAEAAALAQKREEYDKLISEADKYFAQKELDEAAGKYSEALALMNEAYPQGQLEKIESLRTEMAAEAARKAEEEAARLAALSQAEQDAARAELEKRYNGLVAQADQQFEAKKWDDAKQLYREALTVKQDAYPEQQIAKIEEAMRLAAEEEARAAAEAAAAAMARKDQPKDNPEQRELARVISNVEEEVSAKTPSPRTPATPAIVVSDPRPAKASMIKDPEREEKIFEGVQKKAEMDLQKFQEEQEQKRLAEKYTQEKTVEIEETKTTKTTFVYINRSGYVTTYKKVEHNWGGVFYFINNRSTTQRFWEHETQ